MLRFGATLLASLFFLPAAKGQYESFQKEHLTQFFTHCYNAVGTPDGGFLISGIQDLPSSGADDLTHYITKVGCDV